MISERASQRYASAIFAVAEEKKLTEQVRRDFEHIRDAIGSSHELAVFIESPVINMEKKKRVFKAIFEEKVSDLTLKFIILLTSKYREGLIAGIIRDYEDLYDRSLGIINVTVNTAVKITPDQEKSFAGRLEGITGKKVRITFAVDPAIRGGFTVQYGDTVVDASVSHQLDLLRNKLIEKVY